MRTRLLTRSLPFSPSSLGMVAALLLAGPSARVLAQPAAATAAPPRAPAAEAAPAAADATPVAPEPGGSPAPMPPAMTSPPAPVEAAPPPAPVIPATPPAETGPSQDPPSVVEVGIQRLPGSAYPDADNRGIKYGSLWLTFHGMQWPYMPATAKGSRFVLGLSGWGWVDNAYEKFSPWGNNPGIDQNRISYWKQQARLVLRATPTYSLDDGWFIQGQAELVATEDQTITRSDVGGADTDDLWLRIGRWNSWDFTIGRYEGWEVFHLGMGLDQNTFERKGAYGDGDKYNPAFYGVTDNQFRPAGAAGNAAIHLYPTRWLRFELLSTVGSIGSSPVVSTRPVAIVDFGWVKFKAATEYQRLTAQQADDRTHKTSKGIGGALQFVFLPHLEFGVNAAQGTIWSIASDGSFDPKGSLTRTSLGGFLNVSNGHPRHPVIFGVGSLYTHYVDQNDVHMDGVVDDYWQVQNFASVQYIVLNQLWVKLVGGYARGHWDTAEPLSYNDEMYSLRLRISFYF